MKLEMMKYFKFEPLLKTLIWGTENWVISGVAGSETKSNGQPLNSLLRELKADLVGKANYKRFGDEFPLFIKFINAETDLSIQVHPDDDTARRQGLSHGKTEMWFIMDSEPDASIYTGIKKQLTREEYKQKVADNTICDALALYQVKEGDCFFIPAGRIHAIRSGCRLAEIQQTSDITYRVSKTTTAATRMVSHDNYTLRRLQSLLTSTYYPTIRRTMSLVRTKANCL